MTYTHLTQEERYQIHNLKRQGLHLSHIAAQVGRSTSTISRELRRNASARGYEPALAQDKAIARQRQRRNARQFDAAQWQLVELYLRLSLSPQQVSDRLALEAGALVTVDVAKSRVRILPIMSKRHAGHR